MPVIHAEDIADAHQYLAESRPDWRRSMWGIRNDGGPWPCSTCDGASLLSYRCSKCGAEITDSTTSTARSDR